MSLPPINVSGIAFDLDGTLVDTLPDLAHAANKMLEQLGFPSVSMSEFSNYIGHGVDGLINGLLKKFLKNFSEHNTHTLEAHAIFKKEYRLCVPRFSKVYSGVYDALDILKGYQVKLFCVTNKPYEYTRIILRDLALEKYFDLVLAGDTLDRKKPDPLPLNHLSRVFGLPIKRLLMVGDSIVDIKTAREAGCPVFCVSYGYHGQNEIDSLGADAIIDSVRDIFPLISLDQHAC